MGASSVTGVSGLGMSNGLYKPETSAGCGCGGPATVTVAPVTVKTGCFVTVRTGNVTAIRAGSSGVTIKTCS